MGVALLLGMLLLGLLLIGQEQLRRIRRARTMLRTLWRAREAMMQAREAPQALRSVVDILGDGQLVRAAWVGQAEPDGSIKVLATSSGFPGSLRDQLRWDDSAQGQRTSGRAVREDRTLVTPDHRQGPRSALRSEDLRRYNMRSTAATPVHREGKRWGVLTIYGGDSHVLDADLAELLQSLGQALGRLLDDLERSEQLVESHKQLELAIRIAHLGLWSWKEESGLEWLDTHELGSGMKGGLHPADMGAFEAALRSGRPSEGVVRVAGKFYKYWMEPAGNRMVGVLQDVTRTRQVLVDLRRRDERFRMALQNSPVTVFETDQNRRFTWVENPSGYQLEELLGKTPSELDGASSLELEQLMAEVLETGEPRRADIALRNRQYTVSLEARRDEEGRVVGVLGASVDLTELRQAEEQSRLLSHAVNQATMPFMVMDGEGMIRYCNRVFHELSGYSREDCLGRRPPDLLQLEAEISEQIRQTLWAGRPWTGELLVTRKSGERVWEWVSLSPVLNRDGGVNQFVAVSQDISARKAAEEELEAARKALSQAQKLEAVGRLAGGIAHDFNNLLANIIGNCERVRGGLKNKELAAGLEEALGAARRGAALTRQLLAFSRGQALEPARVDLNRELQALQPSLERLVGGAVQFELCPGPLEVDLDSTLLEVAVNHLVKNAIRAGGQLTLRTRSQEGQAVLEVSDTGSGMDEATRGRIFEPFFSTAARAGLGLATVYGIVRQSGGEIEVESELGQGTTVRIRLPRHEPQKEAPLPSAATRVLLVEDQPDLLGLFSMLLTKKGYQVESALSAEDALALGRADFDLLLSDVSLTGLDGYQLAERLRDQNPELRVVLMSGYTDLTSKLPFTLVHKPFTPDELYRRVAEAFLKPPGE